MGITRMDLSPKYKKYDIGKYTYGDPQIMSWKLRCGNLKIGKFCSIARGVQIMLGGNHNGDWVTTSPIDTFLPFTSSSAERKRSIQVSTKGDVIIGNDVWLATEALILSGVTIGDGAIIGARCVVAKDIPPYSVVVGNPAVVVKKRFDDETIEKLLEIKWWDWDDEKIRANGKSLLSPKVEKFVKRNSERNGE